LFSSPSPTACAFSLVRRTPASHLRRITQLTEMIQLFSTQPGKRGLSYDDFAVLLQRGGLV
jgi:pentose-5-phosphate-3-epimerase